MERIRPKGLGLGSRASRVTCLSGHVPLWSRASRVTCHVPLGSRVTCLSGHVPLGSRVTCLLGHGCACSSVFHEVRAQACNDNCVICGCGSVPDQLAGGARRGAPLQGGGCQGRGARCAAAVVQRLQVVPNIPLLQSTVSFLSKISQSMCEKA
jgi:hypothetical protein